MEVCIFHILLFSFLSSRNIFMILLHFLIIVNFDFLSVKGIDNYCFSKFQFLLFNI